MKDQIQSDLEKALKDKDEVKRTTLRLLLSEIHNKEIETKKQKEGLTDEEIASVVRKEVKKRKESIEAYRKGKRDDLVRKEEAELDVLNKYLPQQISPEELEKVVRAVVEETKAVGAKDFGKVMGAVMGKVKGQAEGAVVAETVRKVLG